MKTLLPRALAAKNVWTWLFEVVMLNWKVCTFSGALVSAFTNQIGRALDNFFRPPSSFFYVLTDESIASGCHCICY